jgi:myo-inositol catabolism protein IolC
MTPKHEYAVILVYSISHAVRIEDMLKKAGIEAKMIPTPRHLSSDCGSAVRILAADKASCEQLILDANVEYQDILDLDR